MKKVIIFLALGLSALGLRAQTPMPLPGGSFEQWTSHPGYNVTVLFMPINVYGPYTTPTGWSHLSYPVNETTSLMGMTININTSVPLVSAMPDTAGAPVRCRRLPAAHVSRRGQSRVPVDPPR